jgi:uncharacterized cupin superfamily protein
MLSTIVARSAEIELDLPPIPQEWILDGTPEAREKDIASSRGGAMKVVVWSCTKGMFRWQYVVDEVVHILSGEVFIVDHVGNERRFGPGDVAFFPAGSSSVWHVTEDVRKVAVLNVPVPKLACLFLQIWNRIGRAVRPRFGLDAAAQGAVRCLGEGALM